MSLTISKNRDVTLSKARHLVCLEAAFELESLAYVLPGLITDEDDDNGARYAVRGVAGRILQLSKSLMAGLSDKVAETVELQADVYVTLPKLPQE